MASRPEFQQKQYAFAAHIRDPENNPAPSGVEDRRMAIYRELFFNNLHNLIGSTFPVIKKLHKPGKFRSLIRAFMIQHEAQTPYFLEIPREFLAFLQDEYELQDDDFPFLIELAHYEWVELALSVSEEVNDTTNVDADGDLLQGIPVPSLLTWTFAYQYPVHRISTDYQPTEPGEAPTFLAVCRKANDDMDFMELNPVTARLLELIEANEQHTGRELLLKLAQEINYPDVEALVRHGVETMQQMRLAEILLGSRK
ncbi:MAG: putative DNA-binding domain-containing protein [Proteobacteria bacterium]|nr:putative DNA-binding domain-containing protein [Pseudomonadota bacterium]